MLKYLLGLISLLMLGSCAKQTIYSSKWYDSKITIDGKLDEWEKPLLQPATQTEIYCAFANDDKFLYVAVRLPDKTIQAMTYQLGLTVWVDTLAKKRNSIGIGFPLPLTKGQMDQLNMAYAKGGQPAMENTYSELSQEFELIGIVEERLRISNLASKSMKVGAHFDELGALTLEYKIPFKQLYKRNPSLDRALSIGIKVNSPEQNADDDPGLFDDTNANPITQSNQANPMMQQGAGMGRNLPGRTSSTEAMRRQLNNNVSMPNVWLKMQLSKE